MSFVTEPNDKRVSENDHVVMDCLAQGEPPVDIRWQKNGARVLESDGVRFLPNGSLYLSSVSRGVEQSDEGFYQCLARNKYGAILSQRAHLTISSEYGTEEVCCIEPKPVSALMYILTKKKVCVQLSLSRTYNFYFF